MKWQFIAILSIAVWACSAMLVRAKTIAAPVLIEGAVVAEGVPEPDAHVTLTVDPILGPSAVRQIGTTDSNGAFEILVDSRLISHPYILTATSDDPHYFTVDDVAGTITNDEKPVVLAMHRPGRDRAYDPSYHAFLDGASRSFFFVTDRAPEHNSYGSTPDYSLHYGEFTGWTAADHDVCRTAMGWSCNSQPNNGQYTNVSATSSWTQRHDSSGFDQLIESVRVTRSTDAVIFVHGFNQSFAQAEAALIRLTFETDWRNRPAILYSWPSQGDVRRYAMDSDNVDSSTATAHFQDFLTQLVRNMPEVQLHIVAHSMGNRLLFHTLQAAPNLVDHISSVAYIAADTETTDIDAVAPIVARGPARQDLYYSHNDLALRISACRNGNARLGLGISPPPARVTPYDATDKASTDGWGHGYFVNTLDVASDLNRNVNGQATPFVRELVNVKWLGRRTDSGLTVEESILEGRSACAAAKALELLGIAG